MPLLLGLSLVTPLVVYFAFVATVFAFRLAIPKLKKGVTPRPSTGEGLSWYLNLALNRAMYIAGLKPLVQSFHFTKFLYWRALGARIAYNVSTSIGVTFIDVPMISIGSGSTISEGVIISCHTFTGDRLYIAPVEIGKNVFVGMDCVIGAATKIGDESWIGFGNRLMRDTLDGGTKLDNFEWEHGKPAKKSD